MVEGALTENILVKEKDIVIRTFYESLFLNKPVISQGNFAENQAKVIFTVPVGKVLFVTDYTLGISATDFGTGGNGGITFANSWFIDKLVGVPNDILIAHSFIIPLKLDAGETIILTSNAIELVVDGNFRGFLIDE